MACSRTSLPLIISATLFCGEVCLCSDRAFHKENEDDERDNDYSKDEEDIKVSEGRRLLFAQVSETLQRHLVCGNRVSALLKKNTLRLIDIGTHRWIQRVEIFAEPQTVELIAPLLDCLSERSSNTAAFVAQ